MKPICITAQTLLGAARPMRAIHDRYEVDAASGCWLWRGNRDRYGYGVVSIRIGGRSRSVGAHRIAWWAFRGPVQHGHCLDHLCMTKICVNPWHLEPVTSGENSRRAIRAGRGSSGRPKVALDRRKGCGTHGFVDGAWSTQVSDGYVRWNCRPCGRARLERWKAKNRAA